MNSNDRIGENAIRKQPNVNVEDVIFDTMSLFVFWFLVFCAEICRNQNGLETTYDKQTVSCSQHYHSVE